MGIQKILNKKYSTEQKALLKALEVNFGVRTKNIHIYELAFRHKSVASEVKSGCKDSYERLEFLGDAVLGTVIAEYLFKKYPFKSEGFLTDTRSKIVCGKFLAKIAQKLGLDKLIHIQNNARNNLVASAVSDVLEAVIGAIYIDKGFEFTKNVLIKRIIEIHIDIDALSETETNFKSRLIEWSQKEKTNVCFNLKDTKVLNGQKQYTVEIVIDDHVTSEALHNSIKESEQLAAEKAIMLLKEEGRY